MRLPRALVAATVPGTRSRRWLVALLVYVVCTGVCFACASREVLTEHTKYNHYALLADAWLHGRLDLGHAPPPYALNNDFASYQGRWYVSFPPFPAVLLLPWAKMAGTPENLRDGQAWLWFAGLGPAVLFLVLEKLKRMRASEHGERVNALLSGTFAFGTVYFFTALQGTVWFAAHVVAVALSALFLLFALDAERPVLAGCMIGLVFATRPPAVFAAILFGLEAVRVSLARRSIEGFRRLDYEKLAVKLVLFSVPIGFILGLTLLHNRVRFGAPFEFGHSLLTIGWKGRIDKWGLFSYHFFARNLGITLTSLPFWTKTPPYFQINTHGLALWVTTPIYLLLLWPKKKGWHFGVLLAAAIPVVVMDLLYQNSGWLQFGQRFSNDYAVLLFALIAVGGYRLGKRFWALALIGVAVNAFGAMTFDRHGLERFYYTDQSQQIIYQPD